MLLLLLLVRFWSRFSCLIISSSRSNYFFRAKALLFHLISRAIQLFPNYTSSLAKSWIDYSHFLLTFHYVNMTVTYFALRFCIKKNFFFDSHHQRWRGWGVLDRTFCSYHLNFFNTDNLLAWSFARKINFILLQSRTQILHNEAVSVFKVFTMWFLQFTNNEL